MNANRCTLNTVTWYWLLVGLTVPVQAQPEPFIFPGDANLDGKGTPKDIIQVLAANKFERDFDATWSEGDRNGAPNSAFLYPGPPPPGDGVFNTSDIVTALAPEPSTFVLLCLGLLGLCCGRQGPRKVGP